MAFHNNSKIFIPLEPLQKPYIKSYDLNAILMANNDLPLVANQCEENPFTRYGAPPISDPSSTLADPSDFCVEEVNQISVSVESITSPRYYFFSEIQEIIGGTDGEKLPCFLREVTRRHHSGSSFNVDNATLIIDIACSLAEPLVIPPRFTIAGTGLDGEGRLLFHIFWMEYQLFS